MKSVWCEAEKVRESKEMRSVGWVWTGESEGDEVVGWGGGGVQRVRENEEMIRVIW